jgi:hypothetical protein
VSGNADFKSPVSYCSVAVLPRNSDPVKHVLGFPTFTELTPLNKHMLQKAAKNLMVLKTKQNLKVACPT